MILNAVVLHVFQRLTSEMDVHAAAGLHGSPACLLRSTNKQQSATDLWQLWGNSGEGHGSSLAGGALSVAPVPNLVSGQEVTWPVVAPALEWLEALVLKHLLLYRSCSYIVMPYDIPR